MKAEDEPPARPLLPAAGADPLDSDEWAPVRRDLRRRDATGLRLLLRREYDLHCGPARADEVGALMRLWARFSQAVYDEQTDALSRELGLPPRAPGDDIDWDALVSATFDRMLAAFPPAATVDGARGRATFASSCTHRRWCSGSTRWWRRRWRHCAAACSAWPTPP